MIKEYGGYITIDDISAVEMPARDPLVVEELKKRVAERISDLDKEYKQRCMEDRIIRWRMKRIKKKLFKEMWGDVK